MLSDFGVPLKAICPVCCFIADITQQPSNCQTIQCDRCGHFDLSGAASDVLATYPARLDRQLLSEVVVDVCMMAECERPMIDALTASTLIAFATM